MKSFINNYFSDLKSSLLHKRIRYLSKRDWNKRHAEVYKRNPEYLIYCNNESELKHLKLWRVLRKDISFDTLRICYGISNISDHKIIPEEVYVSEIEPCLNHYKEISYIANKNFYNRWFADGIFPHIFFQNIDGDYYDGSYKLLNDDSINSLINNLNYPVVIKPSIGPGGGKDVYFPKNIESLKFHMNKNSNYVVQEVIKQHEFFGKYNEGCLNTLRVCTYRSVNDNNMHVLNVTMRIGKGGSLDNETAGGIVCGVTKDGMLNKYAVDKYGTKYYKHPDNDKDFSDCEYIPLYDELIELSKNISQDIYLCRLASLDACLDKNGNWRIIEINLFNQTIRFSQYAGKPFFGEFTDEVIDYCLKNSGWR